MASAPESVASWLSEKGRKSRWGGDADDALEMNLLARNERLIDLALAENGLSEEVLRSLFQRDDEIIRAAVLSNTRALNQNFGIRYWTFATENNDLSWMASLSKVEAEALFANPALPDHFVADFFEQKGVWEELSEDQRVSAASKIIDTLSDRPERDDFNDGWADYSYSKVFDAAWTFSRSAPVTLKWAYLLGELYSKLAPYAFSKFNALETAERWHPQNDEDQQFEREKDDNASGYLSTFQRVRFGLSRLAAESSHGKKDKRETILGSDDVAIRCGGYLALNFQPEEIEAAVEKDGKLACRYLIGNESIWTKNATRETLREACRSVSKDDDYIVSQSFDFSRQDDRMRERHPEWFVDEEDPLFPDDKPLTESSIGEMTDRLAASTPMINLKAFIEAQSRVDTFRFWVIVVALAVVAFQL